VKVWAFEWCDSVYESAFGMVSLHVSCAGAYWAMRERLLAEWTERRESDIRYGKNRYGVLCHQAWRVRCIEVAP